MSRGHGSVQRHVLAQLQGRGWVSIGLLAESLTGKDQDSRKESVRRAAHTLAREGLVETTMMHRQIKQYGDTYFGNWGNPELMVRLLSVGVPT
jgi:hypothetical protein